MASYTVLQRILLASLLLLLPFAVAGEGEGPKPSQYAPIQDVVAQIDSYLQQIGMDLSAEADVGDDQKSRIAKDANTLVVLAQILANHDQDHERKKSAASLFAASQSLAENAEKCTDAKAAFDSVSAAWQSA